VSILKVTSDGHYERVSGTSLGGGTFTGLCQSLLQRPFDVARALSESGDARNVDMAVGDIYGGHHEPFGLSPTTLASSFGKCGSLKNGRDASVSDGDIARSLLVMITQNIGQVAFLNARRHETRHIFFCGNFIRRNELASRKLAYAIDYWSKGEMEAQFLNHEGYFGAIGAYLGGIKTPRYSPNSSGVTFPV
jgi:pantothenate kinase